MPADLQVDPSLERANPNRGSNKSERSVRSLKAIRLPSQKVRINKIGNLEIKERLSSIITGRTKKPFAQQYNKIIYSNHVRI